MVSLPPRPDILFGRDAELHDLTTTILASGHPPARVCVLGSGGVGKTQLVLSSLHDSRVALKFGQKRFFIPCDSATSRIGLVSTIASYFSVYGDRLERRLLNKLDTLEALVVLDNFESPWESNTRSDVEALLAKLAGLPRLTLVVTMRGAERPLGTQWTRPLMPILLPLDSISAMQTFLHISGATLNDHDVVTVSLLLQKLDYLPLAVTLIATMAQYTSPKTLLERWHRENTSFVERGTHRLASLDVSITISLTSPRLTLYPEARDIMSLLALLPDGFPESPHLLELHDRFPRLRKCIAALKQVGLANDRPDAGTRLLSPIRASTLR